MVEFPKLPGKWSIAEYANGVEPWDLGPDGYCNDCKKSFNGSTEPIWYWDFEWNPDVPTNRKSWFWFCVRCAKANGITW